MISISSKTLSLLRGEKNDKVFAISIVSRRDNRKSLPGEKHTWKYTFRLLTPSSSNSPPLPPAASSTTLTLALRYDQANVLINAASARAQLCVYTSRLGENIRSVGK